MSSADKGKDKSVQNHRTNLSLATGQICPPNLSKIEPIEKEPIAH